MTETDLITAGGSSDNGALPDTVSSDTSTSAAADEQSAPPAPETAPSADVASGNRSGSLSTMVLPELRALAKEIGVEGASGMRKSELVAAIRERRGESNGRRQASAAGEAHTAESAKDAPKTESNTENDDRASTPDAEQQPRRRERRGASRGTGAPDASGDQPDNAAQDAKSGDRQSEQSKSDAKSDGDQQQGGQNRGNSGNGGDDDGEGRGGRRGRRYRDRRRRERGGEGGGDRDTELREDDVVQPVAGILDVLDNYAFVRTSGYLAGPNDVYVSMNMVRKNGLRRGDAVTGAVRVPKDGEGGGQSSGRSSIRWSGWTLSTAARSRTPRNAPTSTSSRRCIRTSGCAWRPPPTD